MLTNLPTVTNNFIIQGIFDIKRAPFVRQIFIKLDTIGLLIRCDAQRVGDFKLRSLLRVRNVSPIRS